MNRLVLLLLLVAPCACAAEWTTHPVSRQPLGVGGTLLVVVCADGDGHACTANIAVLPPGSARAMLVDLRARGETTGAAHRRLGALVTVNGGYFDRAGAPIGLTVVDGRTLSPTVLRSPLSGFAYAAADGSLRLTPVADDAELRVARWARQSGPFVIDPGALPGIRTRGPSAERTVLALNADGALLVIATTPTTLFDLANALLACGRTWSGAPVVCALNLDGGPSTGFHARGDPGIDEAPSAKVSDAWCFVPP